MINLVMKNILLRYVDHWDLKIFHATKKLPREYNIRC